MCTASRPRLRIRKKPPSSTSSRGASSKYVCVRDRPCFQSSLSRDVPLRLICSSARHRLTSGGAQAGCCNAAAAAAALDAASPLRDSSCLSKCADTKAPGSPVRAPCFSPNDAKGSGVLFMLLLLKVAAAPAMSWTAASRVVAHRSMCNPETRCSSSGVQALLVLAAARDGTNERAREMMRTDSAAKETPTRGK